MLIKTKCSEVFPKDGSAVWWPRADALWAVKRPQLKLPGYATFGSLRYF
jgi:hypothetical protein